MSPKTPRDPARALRSVMQALGGRVSIPLSLLRSRLTALSPKVRLELEEESPGLRVRGATHALGARVRFTARLDVGGIDVEGPRRLLKIHLSDVVLSTDEDAPGPLADAIRSGAIDTANPGTLVGNMLSLPEMIVRAEGRTLVLDLLEAPALRRDPMLREAFAAATSLLGVVGLGVADDAIEVRLGILPGGPAEAARSTARAALLPIVRYLWPKGAP